MDLSIANERKAMPNILTVSGREILSQVSENPISVFRGTESNELRKMVEQGLLEQTCEPNGVYKFHITAVGFFALSRAGQIRQ